LSANVCNVSDDFHAAVENKVQNKVHVHDLDAIILHLMGLDYENLTYRYSGLGRLLGC